MPPWLSRQWPAPRLLHTILCSRPHSQLARATAGSVSADRDHLVAATQWLDSAIILPRSVPSTTPDGLIKHIEPLSLPAFRKKTFAVFFLTPAFANWLGDGSTFLQKALQRAYSHGLEEKAAAKRFGVLAAVVDKLPTPCAISETDWLPSQAIERTQNPPMRDIGHEGMAYAFLDSRHVVDQSLRTSSTDDHGSISFSLEYVQEKDVGKGAGEVGRRDIFELPLANTVFQNGATNTMTFSTWERSRGERELKLHSKTKTNRHGLSIIAGRNIRTSTFAIPLMPLTLPRRVHASMGNIVRQFVDESDKIVTASEELERIVPRYFQSRDEASRALSAWALVVPGDAVSDVISETEALLREAGENLQTASMNKEVLWNALWKSDSPVPNQLVVNALAKKARLHRVLSGGGGWGKKAGLLSLEPGIIQQNPASSRSEEPDSSNDMQDLSSALSTVVAPGDHIQFFVSLTPPPADTSRTALQQPSSSESFWTWELGTIPSTIDAMAIPEKPVGSEASGPVVFRHCFGALAEGGMKVKYQNLNRDADQWVDLGGTKLDVPFTRFSMINMDTERSALKKSIKPAVLLNPPAASKRPEPRNAHDNLQYKAISDKSVPEPDAQEQLEWPIRRYAVFKRPEILFASIIKIVRDRTAEFELLMKTIVNRAYSDSSVDSGQSPKQHTIDDRFRLRYRPNPELHNLGASANTCGSHVHQLDIEVRPLLQIIRWRRVSGLEHTADEIRSNVYALTEETRRTFIGMRHDSFDIIQTAVSQNLAMVQTMGTRALGIVQFIRSRAHIISATDATATEIYVAHIALRTEFSNLISAYRKNTLPLRLKLAALRGLEENYFSKESIPQESIRHLLWLLETRAIIPKADAVLGRAERFRRQAEIALGSLSIPSGYLRRRERNVARDVTVKKEVVPSVTKGSVGLSTRPSEHASKSGDPGSPPRRVYKAAPEVTKKEIAKAMKAQRQAFIRIRPEEQVAEKTKRLLEKYEQVVERRKRLLKLGTPPTSIDTHTVTGEVEKPTMTELPNMSYRRVSAWYTSIIQTYKSSHPDDRPVRARHVMPGQPANREAILLLPDEEGRLRSYTSGIPTRRERRLERMRAREEYRVEMNRKELKGAVSEWLKGY